MLDAKKALRTIGRNGQQTNAGRMQAFVSGDTSNTSARDVTECLVAEFGGPKELAREIHTLFEDCEDDRIKLDIFKLIYNSVMKFGEMSKSDDAAKERDVANVIRLMEERDPTLISRAKHLMVYIDNRPPGDAE